MDAVQKLLGDNPTIWVFGYGSLLWKPDFRFKSKKIGYVKDYVRRFHQGNITFRGKPGQPGRVANLEEMKGSQAWGVAYEISGLDDVRHVLQALYTRETASGGYVTMVTTFHPRDDRDGMRVMPISHTNRSNIELIKKSDCNATSEYSHDLHKPQSSLTRVNSNISDTSMDESSSDEETAETMTKRETADEVHHINSVDSLIHYLHGFNNRSENTNRSYTDVETGESFYHESQSSFNIPSNPRRKHPVGINDQGSVPLSVPVLLYTATSNNNLYLGHDDVTSMARQIVGASGSAGSNVEYVTKIAEYVRKYIPEDQDSHLFSLDAKVREEVYRQHAMASTRLQFGFVDLSNDLHDMDHDVLVEPVMAS